MATEKNYYNLTEYLVVKYPDQTFRLDLIQDETALTNETFDNACEWNEENSLDKPIWNDFKDDFISTRSAKLQEMEDKKTADEANKASAKAKLIAGEPLTEEEADTIVL
tara:strand:- start:73 stop:399 length:327 start_codon:yes stop_codon:yes gene_type:complete